jgi:hypothetical protein
MAPRNSPNFQYMRLGGSVKHSSLSRYEPNFKECIPEYKFKVINCNNQFHSTLKCRQYKANDKDTK